MQPVKGMIPSYPRALDIAVVERRELPAVLPYLHLPNIILERRWQKGIATLDNNFVAPKCFCNFE